MEQVYLAPCTEYQYESLKQAVDDVFDHLQLNRFLFQGANVVIKPNLLMKCNPDTAIITHPLLVAAVGTKVKELGGKVTIAESIFISLADIQIWHSSTVSCSIQIVLIVL